MLKRGARVLVSGELTSLSALDLVRRGLALSARTSTGVLTAAQSRTRCRRSSLSIALLRLFCKPQRPILQLHIDRVLHEYQ